MGLRRLQSLYREATRAAHTAKAVIGCGAVREPIALPEAFSVADTGVH